MRRRRVTARWDVRRSDAQQGVLGVTLAQAQFKTAAWALAAQRPDVGGELATVAEQPMFIDAGLGSDTRGCEMRNGECPKCGSHEIYVSTDGSGIAPSGFAWYVRTSRSLTTSFDDQTFLCAQCGYWESYLQNQEVIAEIVANNGGRYWAKVVPAGWLPDPAGRHETRYWDGAVWTPSVSDNGVTSDDPVA